MKKYLFLFLSLFALSFAVKAKQHVAASSAPKSVSSEKAVLRNIGKVSLRNISSTGKYVLGLSSSTSFYWTEEEGTVLLNDKNYSPQVTAISNNGILVGSFLDSTYMYVNSSGETVALKSAGCYKDGKWHSLGIRPEFESNPEGFASSVTCISSDGTVIGGAMYASQGRYAPVVWNNGEPTTFQFEDSGQGAKVQVMSADGKIAGGWAAPNNQRTPILWIDGVAKPVLINGELNYGEVQAISANGKYAVLNSSIYDIENNRHTLLPMIKGMDERAWKLLTIIPMGISDNGIVTGILRDVFSRTDKAFIYTEKNRTMYLNDYVSALGLEVPVDFQFDTAYGISADGSRIIVNGREGFFQAGFVIDIYKHMDGYYPPKFPAITETGYQDITLSWEAANSDEEHTLEGYNVYRNGQKVNETLIQGLSYNDSFTQNGTYLYTVTAVWDGDKESYPTVEAKINWGLMTLPFLDSFDSVSMDTNYWNTSSQGSTGWTVSENFGIPPAALAYISPLKSIYSQAVLSPYLDATNAPEVYLSFNILKQVGIPSIDNSRLKVEVLNGDEWQLAKEFTPVLQEPAFVYEKIDISSLAANKRIRIRFTVYGETTGEYAIWALDNVRVYEPKHELIPSAPIDVVAVKADNGDIKITWADANGVSDLTYFSETEIPDPYLYFGDEGTPFIAANFYEKGELAAYDGYKMLSISAYLGRYIAAEVNEASRAQYKLVAFQGEGNDRVRVLDQAINTESYTQSAWNTFVLDTPLVIDASKDFYYGVEVVYHDPLDRPLSAVLDEKIEGRSDLYSEDGGETWELLSVSIAIRASLAKDANATPKEGIYGYIVYRDGTALNNDNFVPFTNYTDPEAMNLGENVCYQVTTFYNITQQESEKSEKSCVMVGIEDVELSNGGIAVYPNPTSDIIHISGEFTNASLVDVNGKLVLNSTEGEIDVRNISNGIYLLKIETAKGPITKKIIKK